MGVPGPEKNGRRVCDGREPPPPPGQPEVGRAVEEGGLWICLVPAAPLMLALGTAILTHTEPELE